MISSDIMEDINLQIIQILLFFFKSFHILLYGRQIDNWQLHTYKELKTNSLIQLYQHLMVSLTSLIKVI